MRIFLTGGTGVVGRPTLRALVDAGHEVTAMARSDAKAGLVRGAGARPVRVDLFDAPRLRDVVEGHDAVVNLATAIPPPNRALRASAWATNERIRREASANLVDAALAHGIGRFVQESITFGYEDRGDGWIDESVPYTMPAGMTGVVEAEEHTGRFTGAGGTGVVLRFGLFYGPGSTHSELFARWARRGVAFVAGRPDGYMSSIHADDAAAAVVAALEAPAGRWNVVDDRAVTRREFAAVLAAGAGHRRLVRLPGSMARFSRKFGMLTRSQRVSNRSFRDATGWHPAWPSIAQGWSSVIAGRATTPAAVGG